MKTKRSFFIFFLTFLLGFSLQLEASSTNALIKNALRRGEIDSETALIYRVLNVVAPERLPVSYKADKVQFEKCATLTMLELSATWANLSAESQELLKPYLLRNSRLIPKDPKLRDKSVFLSSLPNSYQTTNFNIEWGNTIPGITEWQDIDTNGRPDYIDNLATYLETCWTHAVSTLQLLEPDLSSTYYSNVYVANTGNGAPTLGTNTYGYTTTFPYDAGLSGPLDMAYIVMNSDYSAFPSNDDPEGKFKGAMKVTFAHEFFHVIQFAYDMDEAGWFMELSATWIEDEIFDDVNDYYNYLQGSFGWQMYPYTSLTYFNGSHEYGNVIFGKYLSEKYPGVNVMKEIWEILDDVSGDNAVAALNAFFGNQSTPTTLNDAFNEFTAKNAVMDYEEGANYGGFGVDDNIRHQEEITVYPVTRQISMKSYSNLLPDYLGSNYLKFTNAGSAEQIQFSFNGESSFNGKGITWSAAAVAVRAAGGYDIYEMSINSGGDGTTSVTSFGSGGTYDKIYIVCRVLSETGETPTESSYTPYGSYPAGVSYSIAAALGAISISPMSARLDIGETVQFTATGGTAPYTWDTSDPSIGTIDASGLFTAIQYGTCTVSVTDSLSDGGFSGTITVSEPTTVEKPPESREFPPIRLCFIATAAYGSPLGSEVDVLCRFRDRYLLNNQAGRWFVKNYYHFSPPLAEFISSHPALKTATRILLMPLIVFAKFLLYPGWLFKALFTASLLALTLIISLKICSCHDA